jgi:hypothetical protein
MRSLAGKDFAEAQRLDRLFAMNQGKCRHGLAQDIWNKPDYPAWFKPDEDVFASSTLDGVPKPSGKRVTLSDLRSRPAMATSIAYILMAVATPNPFSQYEKGHGEHIREVSGH